MESMSVLLGQNRMFGTMLKVVHPQFFVKVGALGGLTFKLPAVNDHQHNIRPASYPAFFT